MTGVESNQLDEMRRIAEDTLLDQTCAVYRNPNTASSMGGITNTWNLVSASVPCRMAVRAGIFLAGDMRQRREMEATYAEYILKVAHDADIRAADRIVINGESYNVESTWVEHEYVTLMRCKITRLN